MTVMLTCLFLAALWSSAVRTDLLALLCVVFSCVFVIFPYCVLGEVCYLIVSIPDRCLLPYFKNASTIRKYQITHCRPTQSTIRKSHRTLTLKYIRKTIIVKQPALSSPQRCLQNKKETRNCVYETLCLQPLACFVCLFVLLLYVPSQQLWSWRDGQFT